MDQFEKDVLRQSTVSLVNDLEPRDVLDKLLEDGILTENDYERINETKTRKLRCQLLLSLLPTRGPTAYGSFRRALTSAEYEDLATKLSNVGEKSKQIQNGLPEVPYKKCEKCRSYMPKFDGNSELAVYLERCCCIIVDNLEPIDVLAHHYQENILNDDECERVRVAETRRDRCKLFLQYIANSSSENTPGVLTMSLQKKYSFITKIFENRKRQNLTPEQTNLGSNGFIQNGTHDTTLPSNIVNNTSDLKNRAGVCNLDLHHEKEHRKQVKRFNKKQEENTPNENTNLASENTNNLTESNGVLHVQNRPITNETKKDTDIESRDDTPECNFEICSRPRSVAPHQLSSKRLIVTFNSLSSMINQGHYDRFETYSTKIRTFYSEDHDMMCLLGYLHASRDLFRTDFDAAKKHIKDALQIAPKTSNIKYFMLELFTAKTRMYLSQKKLEKLQDTLDDAKMIIEADTVGCSGRAAGWLYMNDARSITAQIDMITFRSFKSFDTYTWLHEKAKKSFEKALINFQQDGGKDGPFGFGYALCRLAVLLLRCGDNGLTMEILSPPQDDVRQAGCHIQTLEDAETPIPKILEVHFSIAKCDYQFRRKNTVRALEYAEKAYELASELNLLEFTEHAHNRLVFLRTKTPLIIEEIDEEEVSQVLFGEACLSNDSD